MITIYDIAKELHISASTVSRTFSNPGLVNETTRKRVLEKAEEMGYQVNMVASQLRNKFSGQHGAGAGHRRAALHARGAGVVL